MVPGLPEAVSTASPAHLDFPDKDMQQPCSHPLLFKCFLSTFKVPQPVLDTGDPGQSEQALSCPQGTHGQEKLQQLHIPFLLPESQGCATNPTVPIVRWPLCLPPCS